jgi:hypothetical protein
VLAALPLITCIVPALFLWLPLFAIASHLFEEFVWPGGFAQWYRAYPPGYAATVSARFLVAVNAVFIGLAFLPPLLGKTPRGFAYWAVVAAIAAANGLFHLRATIRTRRYSPGLVTGIGLYLPLAIVGITMLLRLELLGFVTLIQAVLIAGAYSVWSTWRHGRHAVVRDVHQTAPKAPQP